MQNTFTVDIFCDVPRFCFSCEFSPENSVPSSRSGQDNGTVYGRYEVPGCGYRGAGYRALVAIRPLSSRLLFWLGKLAGRLVERRPKLQNFAQTNPFAKPHKWTSGRDIIIFLLIFASWIVSDIIIDFGRVFVRFEVYF